MGRGSYSRSVRSISLEPTERDPFYELSLKHEEQNQNGNGRHVGGGHQERVVRKVLPLKERDAHRENLHLGAAGDDEGPEKLVPRPLDDEEGKGGQRRPREWQVDLPVDLERVCPFDRRGLLVVGRDGKKVL